MKSRTLMCMTAMTLFAAPATPVELRLAAQEQQPQQPKKEHARYKLIDTGTLGGDISSLGFDGERDINNRGTVVSVGETLIPDPYAPNCFLPDCFLGHTVDWQNGVLTDLGALPGVNNSGPSWISDSGLISGLSENGVIDPLTGFPEFRAVLFKDGSVVDLGTLGGNESLAFGVNDRGQVVGCAANVAPDSFGFCGGFLGVPQQSRAFLWQDGAIHDLGTLGGPDALAELVNEQGQVAGWSLLDSTPNPVTGIPTQHPFLWENGVMKDLGTIGGTAVFEITNLNSRGQVVGGMNAAGDQSYHPFLWDGELLRDLGTLGGNFGNAQWLNEAGEVTGWANTQGDLANHAFLWRHGSITDLGVLPGGQCSIAYVINSREQVVGESDDCSGGNQRAFVWEKGSIADLNSLVPAGSGVQLTVALGLNEKGEIAAQGVLANGDLHAFLLIPCGESEDGCEGENPTGVTESSSAATTQQRAAKTPAKPALNPALSGRGMLGRLRARRFPWYRVPGPGTGPVN